MKEKITIVFDRYDETDRSTYPETDDLYLVLLISDDGNDLHMAVDTFTTRGWQIYNGIEEVLGYAPTKVGKMPARILFT